MSTTLRPVLRQPFKGDVVLINGHSFDYRVTPEETNGTLCVFECDFLAGSVVPMHCHHREDESFYVLEGNFTFVIGEQEFVAQPGDFIFAPRGVPHSIQANETRRGRIVITLTPGHLGNYFKELAPLMDSGAPFEAIDALNRRYQLEYV